MNEHKGLIHDTSRIESHFIKFILKQNSYVCMYIETVSPPSLTVKKGKDLFMVRMESVTITAY